MNNNENELVDFIVGILEDKKAKEIMVLNVKDITSVADYFVICSGTSTTHIKALADEIEEKLKIEKEMVLHHKEGYNGARWVLLDFIDVVIHIFHQEDRAYYNLEKIWGGTKEVLERGKEHKE